MSFDVRPLSACLGAEIIGIDLAVPLDAGAFKRVHQAHLDHLVVVFREQSLTPEQQIAFSRRFGPLDQHPSDQASLASHPEILVVSTRKENGAYIGLPDAGPKWHSDLSYVATPALGSMLYALQVPNHGGNTGFANMYAAYESLPDDLRTAFEGKRAVFLPGRAQKGGADFKVGFSAAQKDRMPPVAHPVFRTHPETGRKSVFANPQHTIGVEGMDDADCMPLLQQLFDHCAQTRFILRHQWRDGDLVFWDNRCVLHIADLSRLEDPTYQRHLHRTTIMGDVPF
ncbi:MAG: taurine dioxygenase [Gammaproteobacteria bacterium]|jgi:taurine dioxygenase